MSQFANNPPHPFSDEEEVIEDAVPIPAPAPAPVAQPASDPRGILASIIAMPDPAERSQAMRLLEALTPGAQHPLPMPVSAPAPLLFLEPPPPAAKNNRAMAARAIAALNKQDVVKRLAGDWMEYMAYLPSWEVKTPGQVQGHYHNNTVVFCSHCSDWRTEVVVLKSEWEDFLHNAIKSKPELKPVLGVVSQKQWLDGLTQLGYFVGTTVISHTSDKRTKLSVCGIRRYN